MLALRIVATRYLSVFDLVIKVLAGLGLAILTLSTVNETEPMAQRMELLALAAIWATFCFEVVLRLCLEGEHIGRYLGTCIGWLDLAAVVMPAAGLLVGLRRHDAALFCGIWIAKFVRNSTALTLLRRVFANEARNLLGVTWLFVMVIFASALIAYVFERSEQPENFGSIPAAFWWAVTTLTTTGYGDAVPKSFGGRLLAGVVMMAGIGMFALWAGILAAGFAKEMRRHDFLRNWELVAKVPLFTELAAPDLTEIVQQLKQRVVRAGTVVCRKGDPGEQMYFIVEGGVHVGTEPPVELGDGDYFGELALLTGAPRTATITATEETSLLVLDISDFRVFAARSPAMAARMRSEADRRLAALRQMRPEAALAEQPPAMSKQS